MLNRTFMSLFEVSRFKSSSGYSLQLSANTEFGSQCWWLVRLCFCHLCVRPGFNYEFLALEISVIVSFWGNESMDGSSFVLSLNECLALQINNRNKKGSLYVWGATPGWEKGTTNIFKLNSYISPLLVHISLVINSFPFSVRYFIFVPQKFWKQNKLKTKI